MNAIYQPFPMLPGRSGQVWRHQPAYWRPRHFHSEPELNLVVRGTASLGVGARTVTLGPGNVVGFVPGQDHELIDASPDLELFVLAVTPELAVNANITLTTSANRCFSSTPAQLQQISELLAELPKLADGTAVERRLADAFSSLCSDPCRGRVTTDNDKPHALGRRALECLLLKPDASESELAAGLCAAPSSLSRTFRHTWGLTLVEYRARVRLMRFIRLVDEGHSLSHAAFGADFGSYAQCHRVFRRILGCAPQTFFKDTRAAIEDRVRTAPFG